MADTPFPLPRQRRETAVLTGNGGAVYGPFNDFWIFDPEDVKVLAKVAGSVSFLPVSGIIVTKANSNLYSPFTVRFPASVPGTTKFVVRGRRTPKRDVSVLRGSSVSAVQLEAELSRLAATQQEQVRDAEYAWTSEPGQPGGYIKAGLPDHVAVFDALGNVAQQQGFTVGSFLDDVAGVVRNRERAEAADRASELSAKRAETAAQNIEGVPEVLAIKDEILAAPGIAAEVADDRLATEIARDAAFLNANVYPDVASGLAATANGQQFQVRSGNAMIRYRRDSATVAVQVADYPTSRITVESHRAADALNGFVIDDEGQVIPPPSRTLKGYSYLEFLIEDMTTLYQDRAGTIPVTAIGQQVLAIRDRAQGLLLSQIASNPNVATLRADDLGTLYLGSDSASLVQYASADVGNFVVPMYCALAFSPITAGNEPLCYSVANNHLFGNKASNNFRAFATIVNVTLGSKGASTSPGTLTVSMPAVVDGYASQEVISTRWNGGNRNDAVATGYPDGWQLVGAKPLIQVSAATRFYGGVLSHGKAVSEAQRKAVADYFKYRLNIRSLEKLEYDIFGVAGQSNAAGRGDYLTSVKTPWGSGVEYTDGAMKHLSDPTRHYSVSSLSPGNYSTTGSAWPAFAKRYFELTGRRALICGGGASGLGTVNWAQTPAYREMLAQKMLAAKAFIDGYGGKATIKGVIHLGGETDGDSSLPAATTEANIATIHTAFKALTGVPALPMFIMSIDRTSSPTDLYAVTRQALLNAAIPAQNRHHVMPYQDFAGQGKLIDTVHWNQAALNDAGTIAANNIAPLLPN